MRSGRTRLAWALRTPCNALTGADFVPGCEIGPGAHITHPSGLVLAAKARVGSHATFAGGVVVAGVRNYDIEDPEAGSVGETVVGDHVFFGANSVVLVGVAIGDHAVIGANSVVRHDVEARSIVSGIPAKHVAYRTPGRASSRS
ncbi:MAG: hypothetical protein M3Z03_12235 [Actinomycetota bacterium]|nr:hypothetical protein [Actinomycetota bacterium]